MTDLEFYINNMKEIEKKAIENCDKLFLTAVQFSIKTAEEVLEVLIDRMNYLQGKFPCRKNAIVITKLQESLMWLEKRTSDRKKRNVEGKQLA